MRGNNFDFLRLFLAALVVRCHAHLVGWHLPFVQDDYFRDNFFLAGRSCVECFFVVSGFLIFKSWESSKTLARYCERRARRIIPAYALVVVACAVGLSLVSTLSAAEYFRDPLVYKYLAAHAVFLGFLQQTLPGVFEGERFFQHYVNGPLWTIKIEVMFYAVVPLVALLARRTHRAGLFAAIYAASLAWLLGLHAAGRDELAKQLPGQMAFFIAGGAIHYYQDLYRRFVRPLLATSVAILALYHTVGFTWAYPLLPALYPAALAVTVLYVATLAPYFGNFGRFGDFSYGLYIYHFPILQIFNAYRPESQPPWLSFTYAMVVAMVASFLSWHLVEKRWLLQSSHYIQATKTEPPPTDAQAQGPAAQTSAVLASPSIGPAEPVASSESAGL